MKFEHALKTFLDSVVEKDWAKTKSFLDPSQGLHVLLPNRMPITSIEEFENSQQDYYENPEACFEYTLEKCEESEDLGFAVCHAKVLFRKDLEPIHLQISFLFKKVKEEWKIVFDQNSVLPL